MLSNIHLYTNEAEEQNQKVKKIPHHLNKLECSFFEYLYTFIRENRIQDENISIGLDDFGQVMGYRSGSDNNIRKAVASLGEQKFQDGSGNVWSLYEIKNLTAKDRRMELRLSEQFLNLDRPYCSSKLLPIYLMPEKYYSRIILLHLLNNEPDDEKGDNEIYRFTIGREEGDKEFPNLYKVLCSDLTHCGIVPPIWESNYGYFDKTVLAPCIKEIRDITKEATKDIPGGPKIIDILYDKNKVGLDGKVYRQNRRLVFSVYGCADYQLANIGKPINLVPVPEEVEIQEETTYIDNDIEYVAQKEEITVSSPENIADIYPESYEYLLGYGINPEDATELIQGAEAHMAEESYKKRDKWVKRYLEYYMRILCPNKRIDRLDQLIHHVKQDSNAHAHIIDIVIKNS